MDSDGVDPSPPRLYVGGTFTPYGSTIPQHIASWDGTAWTALGDGMNNDVRALAVFDSDGLSGPLAPSLFAGGVFTTAGTGSAERVSRWLGCESRPQCYPNCDGSASTPLLNVNDFICFLNRYGANDPYANCDQSTVPPILNVLDFQCFLNLFAAGCP
jgi:hypothetical protein